LALVSCAWVEFSWLFSEETCPCAELNCEAVEFSWSCVEVSCSWVEESWFCSEPTALLELLLLFPNTLL
jgi:hypothetical protein